jgi:hypothetical protein
VPQPWMTGYEVNDAIDEVALNMQRRDGLPEPKPLHALPLKPIRSLLAAGAVGLGQTAPKVKETLPCIEAGRRQ